MYRHALEPTRRPAPSLRPSGSAASLLPRRSERPSFHCASSAIAGSCWHGPADAEPSSLLSGSDREPCWRGGLAAHSFGDIRIFANASDRPAGTLSRPTGEGRGEGAPVTETRHSHGGAGAAAGRWLAAAVHHDGQENQEIPPVERAFELDPGLFLKPMEAPAERERDKECETFPGGETTCEVDEQTGTPTGKVRVRIDETNPCTRPCVEAHEAVHVRQLKKLCPELRRCYLDADKGKRPASDCLKLAIFGSAQRECEAYGVSVPCVERRLRQAKECRSPASNQAYGERKLASEKCFRDKNCGG